jgi:hypothetical protein
MVGDRRLTHASVAAESEALCHSIFDHLDLTDGAEGVTIQQAEEGARKYETAAARPMQ